MKKITIRGILYSLLIISSLSSKFFDQQSINTSHTASKESTSEPCFIENTTFQDGEKLTYKLYYNWNFIWLSAGEVTFNVHDLGNEYHIAVEGKTYKSYEWFFKVRDYYDSYLDKQSLLPRRFERKVHEGGYRLYEEIDFDQKNNTATNFRGKNKAEARAQEYSLNGCMHDMLSAIYYARNINFNQYEIGEKFPVKIFMDKEIWDLEVKYTGKAQKKRVKGNGRFNTITFSPQVVSGRVFNDGHQMNVYVSDDDNRVPVLIESPVSVGSVKAMLKKHQGLKFKLSSKI